MKVVVIVMAVLSLGSHSVLKGAVASHWLQAALLGKKRPCLSQDISALVRSASQGFKQVQAVPLQLSCLHTLPILCHRHDARTLKHGV